MVDTLPLEKLLRVKLEGRSALSENTSSPNSVNIRIIEIIIILVGFQGRRDVILCHSIA
jgi:hypothetical protein